MPPAKKTKKLTPAQQADLDTQRADPLEGYANLSDSEKVEKLSDLGESGLERVILFEEGQKKPNSKVLTEARKLLASIETSRQETVMAGAPDQQKAKAKAQQKVKPAEAPDEKDDVEPFGKGTIREQAEKSANDPKVDDPVQPVINPGYVRDRDPTEAAVMGESPTGSGPDDLAQRDSAAHLAAEPLRQEVELSHRDRPEMGSQHEVSSQYAEKGEIYPVPPVDPDESLEARDKETDKAEAAAAKEAQAQVKDLKGDDGKVARARSDAPPEIGDPAEPIESNPVVESTPQGTALQIGYRVSRLDQAHDEIGVITEREEPKEAGLVWVTFPKAGKQLLNTNNLAFEGNPEADRALAEAYANSDLRGF